MANKCPECKEGDLALHEVSSGIGVAGIFGVFVAIAGVAVVFLNAEVGFLMVIAGILLGYLSRGTIPEAVCLSCGYRKSLEQTERHQQP